MLPVSLHDGRPDLHSRDVLLELVDDCAVLLGRDFIEHELQILNAVDEVA